MAPLWGFPKHDGTGGIENDLSDTGDSRQDGKKT